MLGYHGYHHARNYAGMAHAEERASRAERALAHLKAKSNEATDMLVEKTLVVGTSAGLGFLQGYREGGMPELLGVGADLWIGVGASAVALFSSELGVGKYGHYLDAIGTGALAFWAANQGVMYGTKKKEASVTGIEGDPSQYAAHSPALTQSHHVPMSPDGIPYGYTRAV